MSKPSGRPARPRRTGARAARDTSRPTQEVTPHDVHLLERARLQWQFGDWQSLAALGQDALQHHPMRAELALFAAAGRLQTGQLDEGRAYLRLARDWGASLEQIGRILISGVYSSLGRFALLAGLRLDAMDRFEAAIGAGSPGADLRLLAQARYAQQIQQLRQLSQQMPRPLQAETPERPLSIATSVSTYILRLALELEDHAVIDLGFNTVRKEWLTVSGDVVEYRTDESAPLYLVSNQNGNFDKPAGDVQISLRAGAAYVISGELAHSGDSSPVVWIFQYDAAGKRIDSASIKTEHGRFKHRFATRSEMRRFDIGIRFSGAGTVTLSKTRLQLCESTAQDLAADFEARLDELARKQKKEVENSMKQIENFLRLQNYLGQDVLLPEMHGWPISPDLGVLLVKLVEQNGYDAVIEFGSGTSTLILARAVQRMAQHTGQSPVPLLSFEHLKEYAGKTRTILAQGRLAKLADVVLTPLVDWLDDQQVRYRFYACEEALARLRQRLPPGKVGKVLVFVDGPPASTGKHARYPALPKVLQAFPPEQFVVHAVLDDYLREDEQQIVASWVQHLQQRGIPHTVTKYPNLEKMACLIEVGGKRTDEE
ncbi:hypothetical protein [Rehaibacterium terrae]|jgi:hypothetical protein|uniref:Uncharacterized protein n=1 Tax=Rehaibacterium terrae TaxID=1341696 RepID=A0A7W7V7A3_9GAMM|nr:hypothetical protein [Rehaibacterium terrae]MBB5014458.1 hypothetical protein [Rehaibacterium terrae]